MKILGLSSVVGFAFLSTALTQEPAVPLDRTSLPPALREVPLERLSSGALLRLNRGNNLVRPSRDSGKPHRASALAEQGAVTLDPRIGPNIRLGDDPPALPSNQRAQAEPHISRSPVLPDFLAATFQEGRFTDGGAIDCGYAISHDGGLSWSRALIPALTQVVGGPYFRATDPVVAIASNGNVYINTDDATDQNFDTGVVTVSRSTDGGNTFQPPVVAYAPPGDNYFPDKNWMAVNTFAGTPTAGRIVVTLTVFVGSVSPLARAYSDDGGVTWSDPAFVTPFASNMQGSQPVFLPDGRLAIVYWNFRTNTGGDDRIEVIVSSDGGATFGPATVVASVPNLYAEPNIRSGSFLPSAAGDRTTSNLYVVYQAVHQGSPRILFTKSADAGATWSVPIPVSDNPFGSGVFNPAISASADGQRLTAVFYDHRANPGSTTLVDMYMAQSVDGGATWQPNIRLTSVSSDASIAPLAVDDDGDPAGYMLGDYLGVAAPTNLKVPAVPVWVDTRTGNSDPFVTRAGIAPTLTLESWEAARVSYEELTNPEFSHVGRELNISTRLRVQPGENALIGGFIIAGSEPKNVIVRGIGPSLAAKGVQGELADPTLEIFQGNTSIAVNDDWKDTQQSEIQATTIRPGSELESAIVRTLDPGSYTVVLRGKGESSGVGLVEVYDLSQGEASKLANTSTRGFVDAGENVMIGGFIVGTGSAPAGTGAAKVLVRAIGPSLAQSDVANPLTDPLLELHDGNGVLFATNDNWKDSQQAEIEATELAPTDDRESAVLAFVPQGNYTAIVRGKDNTAGVGLVEIYNVP